MDLSVIIAYCGEYPQSLFTIQAVNQNLIESNIKYEIIAVNNYCDQVKMQCANQLANFHANARNSKFDFKALSEAHKAVRPMYYDKSGDAIQAAERLNPWLKYLEHNEWLSHWEAKRIGVLNSKGRYLLFLDAHTIPSHNAIPKMYQEYIANDLDLEGSIHLPLTYKILESHRLIYKLKIENDHFYSYSFTSFRPENDPYEVPCMSTCGMMISRKLYDQIGGWPKGMSSYGGGENFLNYTLSVIGKKKFIYPYATLFHHGEARDYHWEYSGFVRNRMIAHYLFGGTDLLDKFTSITKGRPKTLASLRDSVLLEQKDHRELIKSQQVTSIQEWSKEWM